MAVLWSFISRLLLDINFSKFSLLLLTIKVDELRITPFRRCSRLGLILVMEHDSPVSLLLFLQSHRMRGVVRAPSRLANDLVSGSVVALGPLLNLSHSPLIVVVAIQELVFRLFFGLPLAGRRHAEKLKHKVSDEFQVSWVGQVTLPCCRLRWCPFNRSKFLLS